ncbi:MAG: hypothetical protein OEY16_02835 [Alphaproteobacteria bacterium]|nr:hypothetical protein [Alphaproteobacteria bacterium]
MSIRRSNIVDATALHDNLGSVEPMIRRSDRKVPEKPTTEMLAAGSTAGGVSVEAAWDIYQAMLKAAS